MSQCGPFEMVALSLLIEPQGPPITGEAKPDAPPEKEMLPTGANKEEPAFKKYS